MNVGESQDENVPAGTALCQTQHISKVGHVTLALKEILTQ